MESFNLAAVLFAVLILVWLGYAVPRIAARRDLMGQTRAADLARDSATVRDLSPAIRSRRRPPEVTTAMPTSRLLARPADPTQRPRFEEPTRISLEAPARPAGPVDLAARARAVLRIALLALIGLTLVLALAAVLGPVPAVIPILVALLAGADAALLVRSQSVARERARRAARAERERAGERSRRRPLPVAEGRSENEDDSAECEASVAAGGDAPAERDAQTAEPVPSATSRPAGFGIEAGMVAREWTPRPVPRPAYSLRGEVEDLSQRHDVHRRSVLGDAVPLEHEDVEEIEARIEQVENLAPAVDLDLDAVLARRRGA